MISYDRTYCDPIPAGMSRYVDFYSAKDAADKLGISDRYIRIKARNREPQAYWDSEAPKLLLFRKADIKARAR
jgi:hypothetical protein